MIQRGSVRQSAIVVLLVVVMAASTLVLGIAGATSAPGRATSTTAGPLGAPTLFTPQVTCTYTISSENVGNNAIQSEINVAPAGSTICIGPGTYPEQLTITTSGLTLYGAGNASTILAPTSVAFNTLDWDSAGGSSSSVACGSQLCVPTAAIVLVENTTSGPTTGVTIANLAVNGAPAASSVTCGDDYVGVDFQDSSGTLAAASVVNVASPLSSFGCQEVSGAVYAYNGYYYTNHVPSPAIAVTVANSTVTGYQKNGITCDDLGETCTLTGNTVTGIGATTLNAQNGIQIGYGASATVSGNHVTGDHYTGGVPDNADYFQPVYVATGILVYDGGNSIRVLSNTVNGDDLGIAVLGTAAANVSGNQITQGFSYGITFDLNASSAYLGMPVYSTVTPWTSTAYGNTMENVNVGMLVYDDNVTVGGGSASAVNVSVESMFDTHNAYTVGLKGFSAQVNVSGALLGNISGYQSTTGWNPLAVGSYTLVGDSFTAVGAPAAAQYGVLLNGTTATVRGVSVTGFYWGIQGGDVFPAASVEPIGTYLVTGSTVTGSVASGVPGGIGIVVFAAAVTISHNSVSGYSLQTTSTNGGTTYSSWFEDTQSIGIYVGCAEGSSTCLVAQNTLNDNSVGIVDALMTYGFQSITPSNASILKNTVTDSGAYGVLVEATGAAGTTLVQGNVIDNSVSGAPGVFLDGANFLVQGNVLIGTSVTGSNGAFQGQDGCGAAIPTASIEVSDCFNPTTTAALTANFFEQTGVYWSSTFWSNPTSSSLSGGELVTVTEQGLPTGGQWSLVLSGGFTVSTTLSSFVTDLPNGSTSYTATAANPYYAAPAGAISVSGGPTSVVILFGHTPFAVTFTETNLPSTVLHSKGWTVVLAGTVEHVKTASVTFEELNGSYPYVILGPLNQLVLGIPATGTVTVAGAAVTEAFQFSAGHTYVITFSQTGLPAREHWCVTFNTWHLCSPSRTLQFANLTPGVYTYNVSPMTGQTITASIQGYAAPLNGTLTVTNGPTKVVLKYVYPYAVTFTELGLSSGSWAITIGKVTITALYSSPIVFHLPNGTYSFKIGSVLGYTSLGTARTVKVHGGAAHATVFFWSKGLDPLVGGSAIAVPARSD